MDQFLCGGLQSSPLLPLLLIAALTPQSRPPAPTVPQPANNLQQAAQEAANAYVVAMSAYERASAAFRGFVDTQPAHVRQVMSNSFHGDPGLQTGGLCIP